MQTVACYNMTKINNALTYAVVHSMDISVEPRPLLNRRVIYKLSSVIHISVSSAVQVWNALTRTLWRYADGTSFLTVPFQWLIQHAWALVSAVSDSRINKSTVGCPSFGSLQQKHI